MATLQELFGIALPIVQAPMATAQGSVLATAVGNAGGLGSLPCAMLDSGQIAAEVNALRAAGDRPFNLNFFCHEAPVFDAARDAAWRRALAPYYDEFALAWPDGAAGPARQPFGAEAAELVRALRPAVVSFHYGLPAPELLDAVRASGARIVSSATTVDEARWLEARGVDAIVAQGLEAGGHRGMFLSHDLTRQLGTLSLVPQVARAVRVPVIAAGGICDARGVAAALALGAAGVQVGTAYLLCPEATTHPLHRAALASDDACHTALTNVFTGRPARSIVNRVVRELGPLCAAAPAFPLAAAAMMPLRAKAEAQGRADFTPLWAGQNTSGCKAVPAARLTRELAGVD